MNECWGFGTAPFKEKTHLHNLESLSVVRDYLNDGLIYNDILPEHLSYVKGMFRRIHLQDQWDWFTTSMYFGYPPDKDINFITSSLANLRHAIVRQDAHSENSIYQHLKSSNLERYIGNYFSFDPDADSEEELIYVMSSREDRTLMLIGTAKGNMVKRCDEINKSIHMPYLLSPRKVFKVNNGAAAQEAVYLVLRQWQCGNDERLYRAEYKIAVSMIEPALRADKMLRE